MKCSECGSMNFESVGYEDGAGDYGDGFTEVWKCGDCGATTYGQDVFEADELLVNIVDGETGEDGIEEFYDLGGDEPPDDDSAFYAMRDYGLLS